MDSYKSVLDLFGPVSLESLEEPQDIFVVYPHSWVQVTKSGSGNDKIRSQISQFNLNWFGNFLMLLTHVALTAVKTFQHIGSVSQLKLKPFFLI